MRLHGVPEAAIAELYAVSREHRVYGGSVDRRPDRARRRRDRGGWHAPRRRGAAGPQPDGHHLRRRRRASGDRRRPPDRPHLLEPGRPSPARPPCRRAPPHALAAALPRLVAPNGGRRRRRAAPRARQPRRGPPRRSSTNGLDFHERRKERIHGGLADGARTAHELALDLWGSVAERESFLTLSEALGHLDLLEDEGACGRSKATTASCATKLGAARRQEPRS